MVTVIVIEDVTALVPAPSRPLYLLRPTVPNIGITFSLGRAHTKVVPISLVEILFIKLQLILALRSLISIGGSPWVPTVPLLVLARLTVPYFLVRSSDMTPPPYYLVHITAIIPRAFLLAISCFLITRGDTFTLPRTREVTILFLRIRTPTLGTVVKPPINLSSTIGPLIIPLFTPITSTTIFLKLFLILLV